jgi:light-regulated signal transduction histidine kinase (bacteriophytochrome)/CheY-like chemotaxis protein
MPNGQTDDKFEKAMEACAAEPVHIPGLVQPFGCLVASNAKTGRIEYASENCVGILGIDADDLLGQQLSDIFDSEVVHALNNIAAQSEFHKAALPVGQFTIGDAAIDISAFGSAQAHVVQFELAIPSEFDKNDGLKTLGYMIGEIQNCKDSAALFDHTVNLLRHMTGFDRVMVYKFDRQFNGEIVAEKRNRAMESFLGLRFPQWDVPAQARAIMMKLPLRFISDVDKTPVPLKAAYADLPPLDITFADCRGVSAVHMQYLTNMQVKATMTLSVTIEGSLWGIISFHHRKPRLLPSKTREVLTAFLGVFTAKLSLLIKQSELDYFHRTDSIKNTVLDDIGGDDALEESMRRIGEVVKDVLQADGVALLIGSKTVCHGTVPEQPMLQHLLRESQQQLGEQIVSDNMTERYPQFAASLNGCAGVLASSITENHTLCIFRTEITQDINWAGNPEKKIEEVSGVARLAPRGSFSHYLQEMKGHSALWSDEDVYFASRIWMLINTAERRAMQQSISRRQSLMINELNHRVRNIIALVRSVSRQARRHYGSLESYSASLESRIKALAAAHDIASGSVLTAADVKRLVQVETAPYQANYRVTILGESQFLEASIAPIFSLVVHELTTNAAKYGALSVEAGKVIVRINRVDEGIEIQWRESGGPLVKIPNELGFGSALIKQAVPHEMGGTADMRFMHSGVEADFFLPLDVLNVDARPTLPDDPYAKSSIHISGAEAFDPAVFDGLVLLIEDNFVIAKDTKDILEDAGLRDIEISSTISGAFEVLSTERPVFAILDVNLGRSLTSEPIALQLKRLNVPFIFVTGYGDTFDFAAELKSLPCLTKPVPTEDLLSLMMQMMRA